MNDDACQPEWLLVTAFRGEIGRVVSTSRTPHLTLMSGAQGDTYGKQLHRAMGKPRPAVLELARRSIHSAINNRRPTVSEALPVRGVLYRCIASPVVSGRDEVFAVWFWTGPEGEIPQPHPVSGAWSWDLSSRPILATYGSGVRILYDRPDLEPGHPYDINTIASTMEMDTGIDVDRVAELVLKPVDGAQIDLHPIVGRDGGRQASLAAITEVVMAGDTSEWRGVTWDVTSVDPPTASPVRAAAKASAESGVWVGTAYWWPIQVVDMAGYRPWEIVVNPQTHKAVTDSASRGAISQMIANLEAGEQTSREIVWFLTTDSTYAPYEIEASRLIGSTVPAATVMVRRACAEMLTASKHAR